MVDLKMTMRSKGWKIMVGLALVAILLVATRSWGVRNGAERDRGAEKITNLPAKEYRWGVMADIHLDWENLERALELAKKRGQEMVIVAGDLTSVGTEEELGQAKAVLDRLGIKYLVVPGNHDLWAGERAKVDIFGKVFGEKYGAVKMGEIKLILVNNGSSRGLGEEQKAWLWQELGECQKIRCVVVMHMPIKHSFSEHVMGEDSQQVTGEAQELWAKLKSSGVKEIITGHLHYASSYEIEGIRTYVVGAVTSERNNQTPRFIEFVSDGEKMRGEILVLEEQ